MATIAAGWSWGQSTLLRQAKDNEAAPSDASSLGTSKPLSQASAPINAASTSPQTLTIHTSEPSWIALRREGLVEFEGLLNGERRIDDPELVEIYAGRPDLVQLTFPDAETRTLGTVDDIRWIRLSPER